MIQSVAISWHVTCLAMSCHALFPIQLSLFAVYNSALLHAIRLVSEFDCFVLSYLIAPYRIASSHTYNIQHFAGRRKEKSEGNIFTIEQSSYVWCGVV